MWHLESVAERDRTMRTFVCIAPETGRRVTTDNGESLQRKEQLCAGRSIRLFQRTRAKQAYAKDDLEGVMRGQCYCTCAFRPHQLSPFYPVTSRTLFRSRPSAILSPGGQRPCVTTLEQRLNSRCDTIVSTVS